MNNILDYIKNSRIRIPTTTYSPYCRKFMKYPAPTNNSSAKRNGANNGGYKTPCESLSLYRTKDNDVPKIVASILNTEDNNTSDCDNNNGHNNRNYPSLWNDISRTKLFEELAIRGYHIKYRIGEGSYSKVYFTEQKRFYRKDKKKTLIVKPIACKIINRKRTSEGFYEKFLPREVDILQIVNHRHIVQIHSIFEMGPYICICMDYCPMGDLLERIIKQGALSEKRAKLYFQQLCSAIEYLHSMNISHRDIKCENVLIRNRLCVKLTDFGFSRRLDDLRRPNSCKTFCGSTAYAAPEVLKGIPYDPKLFDMWSLGCVLFIMLCGSMPYDDENILNTIKRQEMHIIDFPENKFLSFRAKNIISNLLHPNVNKRLRVEDVLKHPWLVC